MAKNGFREPASGSKKEQFKQMQTELKNSQLAQRISQMMMQQVLNKLQALDRDMNQAMNLLNDLQYRTLATVEIANIDKDLLDSKADAMKLVDYTKASDKEDAEKNYATATTVAEDSIVIIRSDAPNDRGIFRSKFKLADSGVPEMKTALLGKTVGDRVLVKLGEVDHDVEIVGVRTEPPKALVPEVVPATNTVNAVDVTATDNVSYLDTEELEGPTH